MKTAVKERKAKVEQVEEKNENKTTQIIAKMIRETEKAYLLEFLIAYKKSSTKIQRWFPKSRTNFLGTKNVFVAEGSNYSYEEQVFEIEDWILWNLRKELASSFNGIPKRLKFQAIHKKKGTFTLV